MNKMIVYCPGCKRRRRCTVMSQRRGPGNSWIRLKCPNMRCPFFEGFEFQLDDEPVTSQGESDECG